ncbi:hypothetical protein BZK31_03300 [Pseudomonas floridensis]|uniref:Uncharacterized protein n=1 Tax=Pseudomonas floridensis TaxID=1958950 RepID=A0A1X0NB61_9PSED|nr:hypothetical protein BZK31_03300 [Pseudomonas floridensis]
MFENFGETHTPIAFPKQRFDQRDARILGGIPHMDAEITDRYSTAQGIGFQRSCTQAADVIFELHVMLLSLGEPKNNLLGNLLQYP